jgi:hypothetical protein
LRDNGREPAPAALRVIEHLSDNRMNLDSQIDEIRLQYREARAPCSRRSNLLKALLKSLH